MLLKEDLVVREVGEEVLGKLLITEIKMEAMEAEVAIENMEDESVVIEGGVETMAIMMVAIEEEKTDMEANKVKLSLETRTT